MQRHEGSCRTESLRPVALPVILFAVLSLAFPPGIFAQSAGAAPPPEKELIAVLDLEAVGASSVEASAITDRLREELLRSGRYTLVDRSQLETVLDEQALQQTGCTSQECAVKVGQVLGVRKIISGRVTKIADDQWLVSAQMIDVETAETVKAESLRHKGDFFTLMDSTIVDLAGKLSGVAPGARPDARAVVKATPEPPPPPVQAPPPAPVAEEQKDEGWPWWVWGLIGVGVVGAAVALSSQSNSSDSSPSATTQPPPGNPNCTSPSGCGTVSVTW